MIAQSAPPQSPQPAARTRRAPQPGGVLPCRPQRPVAAPACGASVCSTSEQEPQTFAARAPRRRSPACGLQALQNPWLVATRHGRRRQHSVACSDAKREAIQGYTPANYISYTDAEEHRVRLMVACQVDAPPSLCFELWDDWCRLVDFLDLVAQIGLDPKEPQMGLFQCFYRWGRMPIMEIVFLARKLHVVQDQQIVFDTVWGLPANGELTFVENSPSSTTVVLKLECQLPWLLVDLKVDVPSVEAQLREIFSDNFLDFKRLAEGLYAQQPPLPATDEPPPAQQPPPPPAPRSSTGASGSRAQQAHQQDQVDPLTEPPPQVPIAPAGEADADQGQATSPTSSSSSRQRTGSTGGQQQQQPPSQLPQAGVGGGDSAPAPPVKRTRALSRRVTPASAAPGSSAGSAAAAAGPVAGTSSSPQGQDAPPTRRSTGRTSKSAPPPPQPPPAGSTPAPKRRTTRPPSPSGPPNAA